MISGAGGLKLGKFEQKPRPTGLSYAARPGTSEDGATSSIQGQCDTLTMPLSYELDVGLIEWIERFAQGLKDPQLSANSCPSHRFTTQTRSQAYKCNVGALEGRGKPEGGSRQAQSPPRFVEPELAVQFGVMPEVNQGKQLSMILCSYLI